MFEFLYGLIHKNTTIKLIQFFQNYTQLIKRAINVHTKILQDNRATVYINEKYIKS